MARAARDKLDLRVAKQNVNLCQVTVAGAATVRHHTSEHAQLARHKLQS
jgi:hypothetical protein